MFQIPFERAEYLNLDSTPGKLFSINLYLKLVRIFVYTSLLPAKKLLFPFTASLFYFPAASGKYHHRHLRAVHQFVYHKTAQHRIVERAAAALQHQVDIAVELHVLFNGG